MKQILWSLDTKTEVESSSLLSEKELEDLIFEHIEIVDDGLLVIGRQVQLDGGPLDILCIDCNQNTVVLELKKDRTPREVTSQALDYASSVSKLSFQKLYEIYEKTFSNSLSDAYKAKFGTVLDDESQNGFNENTRIIIVASRMDPSTERIVEYLKTFDLPVNVLFFNVFKNNNERLLARAWMIDETEVQKDSKSNKLPWNKEYYGVFKESENRCWEDAKRYGFFSAGGGDYYVRPLYRLTIDSKIWVHVQGLGYCGYGYVTGPPQPANEFVYVDENGDKHDFLTLPGLKGNYYKDSPNEIEHIVPIRWERVFDTKDAKWEPGFFGNQNIVSAPQCEKWAFTVKRLKEIWNIPKE